MTSTAILALTLLFMAFVVIGFLFRKSSKAQVELATLHERLAAKDEELINLSNSLNDSADKIQSQIALNIDGREQITKLQTTLEHERKQFSESRDQMTVAFKNIANEIFDDKSKKFTENNRESLSAILSPLQEKIQHFEKRVEETYDKESKERFSLAKEINNLKELNSRISEDAVNLTNALKGDNKAQGTWGEIVLESILEKSGLVKGREYEVQVSLKAEDGSRSQPDVVVHMPEDRDIIIDSKVSLKAWDAYCAEDEKVAKENHLKQHIQSVRLHIKTLAAKDYQNLIGLNSLDYVFLFMPVEAAYAMAAQSDVELSQYGFERNIIIVVPSTLMTTLKTVHNIWRLAQQNKNAQEIADKAGAMYDKFVAFVGDLEDIGSKIDASKKSFDKAQNKLVTGRGNLMSRVEKLKQLGAKTSKKHNAELAKKAEIERDKDELANAEPAQDDSAKASDKLRH
jgi:DNA recombination protein RmuC